MNDVSEEGARFALGGVMLLLLGCATALLKYAEDEPMQTFAWGLFAFCLFYIGKLVVEQCDALDRARRASFAAAAAPAAQREAA